MQKSIGLSRTVRLDWLDAAAALCLANRPPAEIRQELDRLVEPAQAGAVERERIVDTLMHIWVKADLNLKAKALILYPQLSTREERLCLHYGLILAQYPFFRLCVSILGQISRTQEEVSRKLVKERVTAELGDLGGNDRAIARLFKTWIDWGVLTPDDKNRFFHINLRNISTSNIELEKWLLACALHAHPSDSLPYADLIGLPELFPFSFNITVDELKKDDRFEVQRQGGGLEMVRINQHHK